MSFRPEPGLVIRYDFLWKEEEDNGVAHGKKDRPCAIVLTTQPNEDGLSEVYLCPITHSPPQEGETGLEVPAKLARYLKLDDEQSWVKTHQINIVKWEKNRLPYGVVKAHDEEWFFGKLPQSFARKVFDQVRENFQNKTLKPTQRA